MKEARYFYVPDAAQQRELPAEECQHAIRVLRLKVGDELFLMDGVGNYYRAEVTDAPVDRPCASGHRSDEDDGPNGVDGGEGNGDRH